MERVPLMYNSRRSIKNRACFSLSSVFCLILPFQPSKAALLCFEDHFSSKLLPHTDEFNSVMRFFFTKVESNQVTNTTL
jgi:hypothetical protein